MAIGAIDYIDQLLVKKYAQEKVDNHDPIESMIQPEKMMEVMNDYSNMSKNMFALSQKLTSACYAVNARNAQYRKAATLES
ncbi:MAG: hypothetical protein WCY19_07460 [Candidatus Gastranaerophilaceae bacterium]